MNDELRSRHIAFAAKLVRDSYLLEGLDGPPTSEQLDACGSLMRRAGVMIRELSDELRKLIKEQDE